MMDVLASDVLAGINERLVRSFRESIFIAPLYMYVVRSEDDELTLVRFWVCG